MFSSLFNWLMGAGRELAVVLISMVPLVELRGAVPLGAVAGVPAIELIPLAVIGNMIPIPRIRIAKSLAANRSAQTFFQEYQE